MGVANLILHSLEPPPDSMPCLKITLPNNQGEVMHVLAGEKITIGRRPDNTIQIIDGTVSAHHAELIGVNGHWRLHDLGSTNLTCVDGQPVTDFHLHGLCKVLFGTIQAEYIPETPESAPSTKTEMVPTRAEMEFLRRENLDLQSKLFAMQKQIDILGSARLMTKETTQLGVQPDVHRRIVGERDELQKANAGLELDAENLKCDLVAITRDRDALRQAWETVKGELAAAELQIAKLSNATRPALKPTVPLTPAPTLADTQPLVTAEQHRQIANVLTKAPGIIESLRQTLGKLAAAPDDAAALQRLSAEGKDLAACAAPVEGHPIQRLASGIESLATDLAGTAAPIDAATLRTLTQAADLLPALLDPRALKRAKELQTPRVLALDDDQGLLATVVATLEVADLETTGRSTPAGALEELRSSTYDLVLLDIALPGKSGLDICTEIRALPGYRNTPIVFLTVANTVENRAQSSLNGGTDFLTKPFNTLELALKVSVWIFKSQFGLL